MGLFNKLFGKKEETEAKEVAQTTVVIDMSKSAENLDKVLIDMSKGSKIDMSKHTARVALAMDYSGSMGNLFRKGDVQKVVTRLLPIALKFDDNGELESWLFSERSKRLSVVNGDNYDTYVKEVMMGSGMAMGGTNYAPVLKDIVKHYKDVEPSDVPAFIIFITDGDNWDRTATDEIVKELSNYNMFVQFIGIGNERFEYLKALDDMEGRAHDNTGFTAVKDMNALTDEELYTEILRQYKDWLNNK